MYKKSIDLVIDKLAKEFIKLDSKYVREEYMLILLAVKAWEFENEAIKRKHMAP